MCVCVYLYMCVFLYTTQIKYFGNVFIFVLLNFCLDSPTEKKNQFKPI